MRVYVDSQSIKPQVSSKVAYYPHLLKSRIGLGIACVSLSLSALLYVLFQWNIVFMTIAALTAVAVFVYLGHLLAHELPDKDAQAPEIYTASIQRKLAEAITGKISSKGEASIPYKLAREINKLEKAYTTYEHRECERRYQEELEESRNASRLNYENKRQAILQRTSSETKA